MGRTRHDLRPLPPGQGLSSPAHRAFAGARASRPDRRAAYRDGVVRLSRVVVVLAALVRSVLADIDNAGAVAAPAGRAEVSSPHVDGERAAVLRTEADTLTSYL